jgi:flagella basal body P-ring formation protein FlgA
MKKLKTKPYLLASLALLASGFIYATGAHAANWKTPAEAVQLAAIQNGTPLVDETIDTTPRQRYFQITNDDVGKAVAEQMQKQGFRQQVTATLNPAPSTVIYSADHPLKIAIHALQVDTDAKLWQGQVYVIANNKTETVKPIAGRYDATLTVPVLTRQLRSGDVIEATDIEMKSFPERQLRKDTVTSLNAIVGQSPRGMISPGRPLRMAEIIQPTVIKKGDLVEMNYSTPYMHIRATGEALEDGSNGSLIRVKNNKSDKAISARVTAPGQVEVNSDVL